MKVLEYFLQISINYVGLNALKKVDVKKISYKTLMRLVAVINAIDIGIILLITNITKNIFLKMVIAIPMAFIMLFISYKGAGFILKKKGMTKNES